MSESQQPRVVEAGAVLLDGPLSPWVKLALIRRPEPEDDWTLPKGHVEAGETLEAAAARELLEETGYTGRLTGIADTRSYETPDGVDKSVTYFFVEHDGAPQRATPLDGVSQVEWLTFDEAVERATYADLKRFIARLAPPGRWLPGEEPGAGNRPTTPSVYDHDEPRRGVTRRERLRSAIAVYEQELRGLRSRPRRVDATVAERSLPEFTSVWWRAPADALLDEARALSTTKKVDAAWDAFHASRRLSLYELDEEELSSRRAALRAEVDSKLDGWRKDAADWMLTPAVTWPPRALISAQRVLDDHFTNVYMRLQLASHRIGLAAALLTVTILALWLCTALGAFSALDVQDPFVLADPALFAGIMLLGMFGAMLSVTLSSKSDAGRGRLYDLTMTRWAVPLARLAVGAGSAVVAVATIQSTLPTGEPWVFLLAIPAGFSERIVRNAVAALEARSQAPGS